MNKRKIVIMLIFSFIAFQGFAQGKSHKIALTGTVSTAAGKPVVNAFLFIDGSQTNIKTNRKGCYKIKISEKTNTISVYSESCGSEEVTFRNQVPVDFILSGSFNARVEPKKENKEKVNIGYGEAEREEITTNVSIMDKDLSQKQYYSNIYSMIQGKVPSVQVVGEKIIIRGISTNSDNTQPIFVVDGVIVTSISQIDPLQVESINILKGAAGSIYGVNGANGVIIINLRKK